jgi:hypothetical protein
MYASYLFFFCRVGWNWIRMVSWPVFDLYQPWMRDEYECGAVCWMRIGKGNQSTWRQPTPFPLCPPQIPHDMTWLGLLQWDSFIPGLVGCMWLPLYHTQIDVLKWLVLGCFPGSSLYSTLFWWQPQLKIQSHTQVAKGRRMFKTFLLR